MSRLYDTIEPSVITEEMLRDSVIKQGPQGEAGEIAKSEGMSFVKVLNLRLSYKNILEIDNLWWFKNVTKLQLDNNIIDKLSGLSSLVSLKWLDLSFNNIERIEGLEALVNIEDLTLYNNRISVIENLESLERLHFLSVGNNLLNDIENVKYLRKFKNLRALNISGNPFCKKEEFRVILLAFVNQLVYLDYKLINDDERTRCYEKEQFHVQALQEDEKEKESLMEKHKENEMKEELYKMAYVNDLDKDQLFDSIFTDDPDGQRLRELPKNIEHAEEFRKKFWESVYGLFEIGLEEYKKREEEVASFWDCLNEAKATNKQNGIDLITKFIEYKHHVVNVISNENDSDDLLRNEFKQKVRELQFKLMELELHLVDQIEETVTEFERNLNDMVGKFREQVETNLGKCRELDMTYQAKISEEALAIQEKINKGDPTEDLSEELKMILIDKDSLTNALSASKDAHMMKIESKADDMNSNIQEWFKNLINTIRNDEEIARNRSRVLEINMLIDNFNMEIDNLDYQMN